MIQTGHYHGFVNRFSSPSLLLIVILTAGFGFANSCGSDSALDPSSLGSSDVGHDSAWDASFDSVDEIGTDAEPWQEGTWIIGYTDQNRPMIVEQFGVNGPVLLLVSAIHGDERTAVTFGEQVRASLQGGLAERAGIRIVFIQAANPDGIAAETRYNTNDIDLNRNFPTENFDQGAGAGGSVPLSEPESRALKEVIDYCQPSAVLSVHCCIPILDYDGPGVELADEMAAGMAPEARFPVGRLGSLPGSMGSYVGVELGIPIVTVEFALATEIDLFDQLASVHQAVEAATAWITVHGSTREVGSLSFLQPPRASLESFVLAESAGGLAVRVETVLQGEGPPVLLLAGLTDNDRRSLNVAEHVRRVLLANVQDVPLIFLTAANPDGIDAGATLNAEGRDVTWDFISGTFETYEADGVAALVDSLGPRMLIDIRADAASDSVASLGLDSGVLDQALPDRLQDLGPATGPFVGFFAERDIPVLLLGVHKWYARGDDQEWDYFPQSDPVLFSTFVRRIIKPGVLCAQDGFCDRLCTDDPDCECGCDYNQYCEAAARGSAETCPCDPDCEEGETACSADGHCDSWCPEDTDPDCPCSCDFNEYCEAAARGSAETCPCDPDCEEGETACSADGHCDTWCPAGVDPDC